MERYFTTVALLGVNDGNLPVHRSVLIHSLTYDRDYKIMIINQRNTMHLHRY